MVYIVKLGVSDMGAPLVPHLLCPQHQSAEATGSDSLEGTQSSHPCEQYPVRIRAVASMSKRARVQRWGFL